MSRTAQREVADAAGAEAVAFLTVDHRDMDPLIDAVLDGATGDDELLGQAGNDNLYGGADEDTLDGGSGNHPECLGNEGMDDAPADLDVIRNCE